MKAGNRLASVTSIVFCLATLVWALWRVSAAWYFLAAETAAAPLFETGGGSPESFTQAENRINQALQRYPNNPDYLGFSGRIHVLRARQPGVMGAERRELFEFAAVRYRQALSVRPLWPYSWARLLSIKSQLGQIDTEFRLALRRSAETGPWEPGVQLQLIESGLRYWSWLGQTEWQLVEQVIIDGMKVQPSSVFDIVRSFGRPDLICKLETGRRQSQVRRWCESVLQG